MIKNMRMKKNFYTVVVYIGLMNLFCVDVLHGIFANVASLKSDLNTEFGYQASNDIFVVAVTRTPVSSLSGSAPLISHNEFEMVLELLYASCVYPGNWLSRWWRGNDATVSPPYSRGLVTLNDTVDNLIDSAGGLPISVINAVNSVKQDIGRYFISNNMRDACKLVVFNEMFFSQLEPLSTVQKDFIEGKIFDLSRSSLNTVFYPNFLYIETRNVSGLTVHNDLIRMGTNAGAYGSSGINSVFHGVISTFTANPSMFFNDAGRTLTQCARLVQRNVPNNNNLVAWKYLINETHTINGGSVLARYKKVGYFRENDNSIKNGALYDSGPGYDEAVLIGTNSLRDRLLRNISIDICLDLNIGIRSRGVNHWMNPSGTPLGDSRLHIIQSNSIDPFYNPVNRMNLPVNRGIIHVDKYPHPSWNVPGMVNRPQDIYFPYIDARTGDLKDDFLHYKSEFHLRIAESDYRFSFLKI